MTQHHESWYPSQFSIFRTILCTSIIHLNFYKLHLHIAGNETRVPETLGKMVASLQLEEAEPEGESTETHSSSPPRVICSHCQHLTDYVKLFMEEG